MKLALAFCLQYILGYCQLTNDSPVMADAQVFTSKHDAQADSVFIEGKYFRYKALNNLTDSIEGYWYNDSSGIYFLSMEYYKIGCKAPVCMYRFTNPIDQNERMDIPCYDSLDAKVIDYAVHRSGIFTYSRNEETIVVFLHVLCTDYDQPQVLVDEMEPILPFCKQRKFVYSLQAGLIGMETNGNKCDKCIFPYDKLVYSK